MSSFISKNLKKICMLTVLFFPLSLAALTEKEKLVDEFITVSLASIPEVDDQLAKSTPHDFQNQFAEDQEKFDKIYLSHSKKMGEAKQKNLIALMKKVLTPVLMSSYSEDDFKGMLTLNKMPINEKMKKLAPKLTNASYEIGQKFMQMCFTKTMRLSLTEARQKGLNKEFLAAADAYLKENDINIEEIMKEFGDTPKTMTSSDLPKQKLIDQLLSIQLSEQLNITKVVSSNAIKALSQNRFGSLYGADLTKFNEIFEKNLDQIMSKLSKSFENKMKTCVQPFYTKYFNAQELQELLDIQNNPLTKKQLEIATKMAQMTPAFIKAQEEMKNNPIVEAYIEIFEEAKKQGLKSPRIDQILGEMKATRK